MKPGTYSVKAVIGGAESALNSVTVGADTTESRIAFNVWEDGTFTADTDKSEFTVSAQAGASNTYQCFAVMGQNLTGERYIRANLKLNEGVTAGMVEGDEQRFGLQINFDGTPVSVTYLHDKNQNQIQEMTNWSNSGTVGAEGNFFTDAVIQRLESVGIDLLVHISADNVFNVYLDVDGNGYQLCTNMTKTSEQWDFLNKQIIAIGVVGWGTEKDTDGYDYTVTVSYSDTAPEGMPEV